MKFYIATWTFILPSPNIITWQWERKSKIETDWDGKYFKRDWLSISFKSCLKVI